MKFRGQLRKALKFYFWIFTGQTIATLSSMHCNNGSIV